MKPLNLILVLLTIAFASVKDAFCDSHYDNCFRSLRNLNTIDLVDNSRFINGFVGDTIMLSFDPSAALRCFRLEVPDTVWINKRTKKKPKEGVHFNLNYAYAGVKAVKGFVTPGYAVSQKAFVVRSVKQREAYSDKFDISLSVSGRPEIIVFSLDDLDERFILTSFGAIRKLNALMGDRVVYSPSLEYFLQPREFKPCTIMSAHYEVSVSKDSLDEAKLVINPQLHLELRADNGENLSYNPFDYKPNQNDDVKAKLLSLDEFESDYEVHVVDSESPSDMAFLNYNFPFSFSEIVGRTWHRAPLFQKLDPTVHYSPLPPAYLDGKSILIADEVVSGGTRYYKACFNGKAFFVKASDVTLPFDEKVKLDSLMKCKATVRDLFFNVTLCNSVMLHYGYLEKIKGMLKKHEAVGIGVGSPDIVFSGYYGFFAGVKIKIMNPTKKAIKRIVATVQGYTSWRSPLGTPITLNGDGLIEPQAACELGKDYLWSSDDVSYAKLCTLKVQYADGSWKNVQKLDNALMENELIEFIFGEDPVAYLD